MSTTPVTTNGHGNGAIIECEEVHKAFGHNVVLDGVSCSLPESQISVIMGPSGTGKSVLLRHFVGLLLPDAVDRLQGEREFEFDPADAVPVADSPPASPLPDDREAP